MIVTGGNQDAAVARRARVVAMLEGVAGAIDAGAFAVPQGKHAVVARAGEQVELLAAPDRRRREVLVQPRLEADTGVLQELARPHQLLIQPAQRRSAVARNEAGRVEPRLCVALVLRQQQPDQCLQTRDKQRVRLEAVTFV